MSGVENILVRRWVIGNWLEGKKAVIIGERDGVQGPSIAECLTAAGAQVMFAGRCYDYG